MEKNKTTWLLLRGLTRGKFHWMEFPELLQKKFPNDQVLLIDLPGNGTRNLEQSPCHISDFTLDIRSELKRQMGDQGKLIIFALSLGAMVTLNWLSKYPNEIEKAYLVNTSAKGITPFYKRLLPKNYLAILVALFSSNYEREKKVLQITSNNLENYERYLIEFEKLADKYPIDPANLYRQLIASANFLLPAQVPKEKITLFTCENDRLVSFENTLALAKKWDLAPIIHPWAGHDLTLDDPEFVLARL